MTVTETNGTVHCENCGKLLDHPLSIPADERPPCPKCGSTARKISVHVQETVGVRENLAVHVGRAVEWMGEHPGWSAVGVGASLGGALAGFFLGPLWGGGIGVALTGLSYWAFKKAIAEGRWPK